MNAASGIMVIAFSSGSLMSIFGTSPSGRSMSRVMRNPSSSTFGRRDSFSESSLLAYP